MRGHTFSRLAYRLLLRAYPREFRTRFSGDLEADFATLLARRGRVHAWRLAMSDLTRKPLAPARIAPRRRLEDLSWDRCSSTCAMRCEAWSSLRRSRS